MALRHAHYLEPVDLKAPEPIGDDLVSTSLLKTDQLQLLRLVLPAGHGLPEHHVAGAITVHCLSGQVSFSARGESYSLTAGQIIALPANEPHAVKAESDSVVLVTVARQ